jgi:hypothetical protein
MAMVCAIRLSPQRGKSLFLAPCRLSGKALHRSWAPVEKSQQTLRTLERSSLPYGFIWFTWNDSVLIQPYRGTADTSRELLERITTRIPTSYSATAVSSSSSQDFSAGSLARGLFQASSIILQSLVPTHLLPVTSSIEKSRTWLGAKSCPGRDRDLLPELLCGRTLSAPPACSDGMASYTSPHHLPK